MERGDIDKNVTILDQPGIRLEGSEIGDVSPCLNNTRVIPFLNFSLWDLSIMLMGFCDRANNPPDYTKF